MKRLSFDVIEKQAASAITEATTLKLLLRKYCEENNIKRDMEGHVLGWESMNLSHAIKLYEFLLQFKGLR